MVKGERAGCQIDVSNDAICRIAERQGVDAACEADGIGPGYAVTVQSAADRAVVNNRYVRTDNADTTCSIGAIAGASNASGAAGTAAQQSSCPHLHRSASSEKRSEPTGAARTTEPASARPAGATSAAYPLITTTDIEGGSVCECNLSAACSATTTTTTAVRGTAIAAAASREVSASRYSRVIP
ncbi:hypothetical protein [Tardiphaga sp. 768_D3_N2_1]|uniref:hypothetical protein n=1 Tax=Tardiphaga sp. 768_D3_N2_1 TaxID=3240783 RepID=UPI003F8C16EF